MAQSKLDRTVQLLIPPSLILLMIVTIIELFYELSLIGVFLIDIFDVYVVIIFAIDLYYRWQEERRVWPYVKKYWLDIIATIPFGFIFFWIDGLALLQGLRGVRSIRGIIRGIRLARTIKATRAIRLIRLGRLSRFARYARLLRLARFGARAPRFLRSRKHIKKAKIRKVQPHEKKMKGVLSFKVILLVTINSIMGTGIWFLTAAGAKHAGPASLISWGILALISVYIAMCFSELTAMFPKAGGVYEFAKQAYGRFWSFVIGWTTSIAGSVTIAMLLLGALQYIIPTTYAHLYVPVAIGLILIFNAVAYRGMQTSTYMLVTFALVTLVTVLAAIIPGLFNIDAENFTPFFVFPTMTVVLTIFFIAETFFGWESAIFLSAETKNPTKVMPKALIYGTIVIAALAFLLAFISMGVIPWERFGESVAPLTDLGEVLFGVTGKIIFTILVFVSIIGAVASWVVTAPRLLMSIAEDKLFFVQFAKIHPKYKSPYVSIIFQVFVISILVYIGSGNYLTLLHMLIPLILIVYCAVLLSVVILRFKKPDHPRPYKVIFGKVGPFVTILFMLFLLFMFVRETHGALEVLKISASLILFGVPAYFAIELFYDKKYITLRRNLVARLFHFVRKFPFSRRTFQQISSYIGPFSKDTVLVDFNSSVGSFASTILKKKYRFNKLFIVNTTPEEISLIKERIVQPMKNKQVILKYTRNWKMPQEVHKVTAFASFHTIGYVDDIQKFLEHVKKALARGGKFCFYVKHYFFDVAPNSLLLADAKKVRKLFTDAGLKVNYVSRKRIGMQEIYLYGKK